MNNKIICHIAGLTSHYKTKLEIFINKISNTIDFFDIDIVTNNIMNDENMISLEEKYNQLKENFNPKSKDIEQEMKEYWQTKLMEEYNNIIENTEKKIIMVGSSIHYKFQNKKIDFDVENKFFLDIKLEKYSKQIIKENLEKYKNEIINGIFPLDYLNHSFLMKKRLGIQKCYQKINYKIMSWNDIIDFLNPCNKEKEFWFASFEKKIPDTTKVYHYPWLALASLIDKNIDITIVNGQPFISEKKELILQELKKKGYLFQITSNNIMINKSNHYQFRVKKPFDVVKEINVDNIFKKLSSYNVKFTYYGISNSDN
jgi:hypothetical protein